MSLTERVKEAKRGAVTIYQSRRCLGNQAYFARLFCDGGIDFGKYRDFLGNGHEAGVLRLSGPEELAELLSLLKLSEEMVLHSFERQRLILEKAAELGIPAFTGVRFARDRREYSGLFANLTILDLPEGLREAEVRWGLSQILEVERGSRLEPGRLKRKKGILIGD